MTLSQIYQIKHFDFPHKMWVTFRRSWASPGPAEFWKTQAHTQDGRLIHEKLVTSEHMESLWKKLQNHPNTEVTLFS